MTSDLTFKQTLIIREMPILKQIGSMVLCLSTMPVVWSFNCHLQTEGVRCTNLHKIISVKTLISFFSYQWMYEEQVT